MKTKAELTTAHIIRKVAPIFNKKGYYGTSMSDITAATDLTKGAIYGNFKNKEDLAFAAFKYNVDLVINQIKLTLSTIDSPLEQLRGMINFYRSYRKRTIEIGGCPILNIGVDAKHQNSEMLYKVQEVVIKLQYSIQRMIEKGQEANEIKQNIDPRKYARQIFALIEGAVFMTITMNDDTYINDMADLADNIVNNELVD